MAKKLWKNIDWTDKEEKREFFNKYFKDGDLVKEQVNKAVGDNKADLKMFIDHNKVQDGKNTRPVKISDIKQRFT